MLKERKPYNERLLLKFIVIVRSVKRAAVAFIANFPAFTVRLSGLTIPVSAIESLEHGASLNHIAHLVLHEATGIRKMQNEGNIN